MNRGMLPMVVAAVGLAATAGAFALETAPQGDSWTQTTVGLANDPTVWTVSSFDGSSVFLPPGMNTAVLTGVKITLSQNLESTLVMKTSKDGAFITNPEALAGATLTIDGAVVPVLTTADADPKPGQHNIPKGLTGLTLDFITSDSKTVTLTDASILSLFSSGDVDLNIGAWSDWTATAQQNITSLTFSSLGSVTASVTYEYAAVPEAGTMLLGGCAVMPILAYRRRSRKA